MATFVVAALSISDCGGNPGDATAAATPRIASPPAAAGDGLLRAAAEGARDHVSGRATLGPAHTDTGKHFDERLKLRVPGHGVAMLRVKTMVVSAGAVGTGGGTRPNG